MFPYLAVHHFVWSHTTVIQSSINGSRSCECRPISFSKIVVDAFKVSSNFILFSINILFPSMLLSTGKNMFTLKLLYNRRKDHCPWDRY